MRICACWCVLLWQCDFKVVLLINTNGYTKHATWAETPPYSEVVAARARTLMGHWPSAGSVPVWSYLWCDCQQVVCPSVAAVAVWRLIKSGQWRACQALIFTPQE